MSTQLPQWPDYLHTLSGAAELTKLLQDATDEQSRQEIYRLLFLALSAGYFTAFADPDHPELVPATNSVLNALTSNPDFVYLQASIEGTGVYRLSGYRGTTLFVHGDLAAGGLGVMDEFGPSVGNFDLDTLQLEDDGYFELLLSGERPADHVGNWVRLDPRARVLVLRQASYDWGSDVDGRFALERIERPLNPVRPDATEIARRLGRLAEYPQRFAQFPLKHMAGMRERGLINRFELDDWAGRGGTTGQYYYQCIYQLRAGEVLLLESEVPEQCLYWNVQVSDPHWNAVDWLNRQTSLNARQARLDTDGRLRVVIAIDDPGVPNWLDTGGFDNGSLMIRWNRASSGPMPKLTSVPITQLRKHLPADTPVVTVEERDEALRQRRRGVQWRRRW